MNKEEALRLAQEALNSCEIDGDGWSGPNYWFDSDKVGRANRAIKQALEQPAPYRAVKTYHDGKPVYVQEPPKREWQGLTEREVDECYKLVMYDMNIEPSRLRIYQAIEAKLMEKNT